MGRPRLLVLLLLLLLASIASTVTLRSGKVVGADMAPQQQPQQPQVPGGAGVWTTGADMLHDAAVFLGHHVFGLVGLGATTGLAYRFGPGAVEWARTRECYQAGSQAYWTSSANATVMAWERQVWAAVGGATACAQRLWEGTHVPEGIMPRQPNPYNEQRKGLDAPNKNLVCVPAILACFLALSWRLLGGMSWPGADAAMWMLVASIVLMVATNKIRDGADFQQLEDVVGDWYGQPTPSQWEAYKWQRALLSLMDGSAGATLCAFLLLGLWAGWAYITRAPRDQLYGWEEVQPPPTPTPPTSPKAHGALEGIIPEEEFKEVSGRCGGQEEEPKRSEAAPSKAAGAVGGGAGPTAGSCRQTPIQQQQAEQEQERTVPTPTVMTVLTPAIPLLSVLKEQQRQLKKNKHKRGKEKADVEGPIKVINLGGGVVRWVFPGNLPDVLIGLSPTPVAEEDEEQQEEAGQEEGEGAPEVKE